MTKMVVWTILDHLGPVHFPTVPRPFPNQVEARQLVVEILKKTPTAAATPHFFLTASPSQTPPHPRGRAKPVPLVKLSL